MARQSPARQSQKVMNGEPLQFTVKVSNPQGFHMRPATAFAQLAARFPCDIFLLKPPQRVNGKSPLELMFLAAEQGTELTVEVSGPDAEGARVAIVEFFVRLADADGEEPPPPGPE